MATKLESLSTKLQSALDLANSLPDAITLDELTNPGSAATMLEGTEMLDAQGKKVTGSIESKDSSDLTASGATVNVPAGYYAEDVSKSVSSGSVNQPTITVDSSGNVKATVSYSSGYISSGSTYGTKALGTGSVSVSGPVVTASAGYYPSSVRKTISSGSVPSPTITVDEDGLITAKTSVSTGYVYSGTKSKTKQLDTQSATTITPTKSSQTAVSAGKYTTGAVTVDPIPSQYQDVSGVTATPARTAAGDVFVDKNGVEQTGTLNVGEVTYNDDAGDKAYADVIGSGSNRLLVSVEPVVVVPSKSSQHITPSEGKLIRSVSVAPIPDEFADVSGVTATTARVASGDKFVDKNGVEQTGTLVTDQIILSHSDGSLVLSVDGETDVGDSTALMGSSSQLGNADPSKVLAGTRFSGEYYLNTSGTMPNNGSMSKTIDGLTTKSATIPAGYTSGGTVALDSTIDDTADSQAAQIAEIKAMLEGKSVSGGGASVETCTVVVNFTSTQDQIIGATTFVDGVISNFTHTKVDSGVTSVTVENVVCGSTLCCKAYSCGAIDLSGANTMNYIGGYQGLMVLSAPTIAGTTETVLLHEI